MTLYQIKLEKAMQILDSIERINLYSQDRNVILEECTRVSNIMSEVITNGLIAGRTD